MSSATSKTAVKPASKKVVSAPSTPPGAAKRTPKFGIAVIGLLLIGVFVLMCVGGLFATVVVADLLSPTFDPIADLFNPRVASAANSNELPGLDEMMENQPPAAPAEQPQQAVPAAPAEQAPVQSQDPASDYSSITPPFIPLGDPVDTSNPIPLPPGLPPDFPTMALEAQTQAMSALMGLPLVTIPEGDGFAWHWNGKGVVTSEVTCPEWVICHETLVDGNATVLFRGHGVEKDVISSGTFRVERLIPGRGGLCFNRWMAEVYEASIVNILHILGEAQACPSLPAQFESRINPLLGERLREVMQLTGVDGVISIGTVKDGFGAFVIYPGSLGTVQTFNCFGGAACAYNSGQGWQWAKGPIELTALNGAVLYDLTVFDSECEAFTGAQSALGSINGGPSCSP